VPASHHCQWSDHLSFLMHYWLLPLSYLIVFKLWSSLEFNCHNLLFSEGYYLCSFVHSMCLLHMPPIIFAPVIPCCKFLSIDHFTTIYFVILLVFFSCLVLSSVIFSTSFPFMTGVNTPQMSQPVVGDIILVVEWFYFVLSNEYRLENSDRLNLLLVPSQAVKCHSEYISTWDQTIEAMLFIFPHCSSELWAYAKHINQPFHLIPRATPFLYLTI
jgi:hypothetical protein